MKITIEEIFCILKYLGVIFFVLFIVFAIIFDDSAGWIQSAIAALEIPIIFYAVKEVTLKPNFKYGFDYHSKDDFKDVKEIPLKKSIITTRKQRKVYFYILNNGKLSAEGVYIQLLYDRPSHGNCSPRIYSNSLIDGNQVFINSKMAEIKFDCINPSQVETFWFEIQDDLKDECRENWNKRRILEIKVTISSKRLNSPIIDYLEVVYDPLKDLV